MFPQQCFHGWANRERITNVSTTMFPFLKPGSHQLIFKPCLFLAGLFSNTSGSPGEAQGAFYSNAIQLPSQFVGIVVVIFWTSFWTLLLFKFINSTIGLFISDSQETHHEELDVSEIHKRNNEERLVKEKLMEATKNGELKQLQELRKKFAVNFAFKDVHQKTAL